MSPGSERLDEWIRAAASRLGEAGVESARLEAQLLAAHVLRVDRTWLLAHPDHEFAALPGESLLQRRLAQEPLAYILGHREFFGREFEVGPAVLIPRPETELLVEWAIEQAPKGGDVLEIGVGSGCVAITIALERPDLNVLATEISPPAAELARRNAERLGAKVQIVHTDLVNGLATGFDLAVSNPPYVRPSDPLPAEVLQEPGLALFGGPDGLDIVRRLAVELKRVLRPGAPFAVEIGEGQMPATQAIFAAQGWTVTEPLNDLAGIARVGTFLAPEPDLVQ